MRFRLRTLLIVLAIAPILLAVIYFEWERRQPIVIEVGTVPGAVVLDENGNEVPR